MATKKLQILGTFPGGSVTIDKTLTQSDTAADAKAVGDLIGNKDGLATTNKDSIVGAINEIATVLHSSSDDNGKFLRVVDGVPTWTSVPSAEEVDF